MSKFKKGDKVRCVNAAKAGGRLTYGKIYTVLGTGVLTFSKFTYVINDNGYEDSYYTHRFKLVTETDKPMAHMFTTTEEK